MPEIPMTLPPPETAVTSISEKMLSAGKVSSRESSRKRIILPLHKHEDDRLQRMLNAIQPDSYIRPHRHALGRAESIIVVSGAILYLVFNSNGGVEDAIRLEAGGVQFGVDIDGDIWHAFIALEPDTVIFEVKPGPYDALTDKEFAPWAPEEYSEGVADYLEELRQYSTTSR